LATADLVDRLHRKIAALLEDKAYKKLKDPTDSVERKTVLLPKSP
jgi:hypothetical protein